MNKKIISLLLGIILLISTPFTCFAADETTDLSPKVVEVNPTREVILQTYWKITDKSFDRQEFGSWREGPSGEGPCTLDINDSINLNKTFTASISGSFPYGAGSIGSVLGITIGKSRIYGVKYSIPVDKAKRKTIIYRPKINVYKVTQTQYRANNITGETKKIKTAVAYVRKFAAWDYSWVWGYYRQ